MAIELVVVDLLAAFAMLVVASFFFALSRRSRAPLHLLFAIAFATLAAGISTVSTSEFDVSGSDLAVDAFRILTHTAAPLMLALGYWSLRQERVVRVGRVVLLAFAVASALAAILYLARPRGTIALGNTQNAFVLAHGAQYLLYLALVALSARTFLRAPTFRHALVPLAFLAYSFSKYTWILIDLSGDTRLVPFVYAWRFLMLALIMVALVRPFLKGDDRAPT